MADYTIWECMVCGWIYDEAKGWPDDGIEPGTRWQDVPDDWLCPECGVGKEDFEMVAINTSTAPTPPPAAPARDQAPIVIVGTGLAGYTLAKEIRKHDSNQPLVLITQDDGCFYSKPLLSTGFHKQKSAADIGSQSATDMARSLHAEVRIFTQVSAIDTAQRTLTLQHKSRTSTLSYAKLVLALGSDAISAPLAGDAAGEIYTVNDLQDYARFHAASVGKRRVLIVGAGLIGSEYTNDLVQSGFEVQVVDPLDRIIGNLLPAPVSQAVQKKLEAAGARFHLGCTVSSLTRQQGELVATLSDGQTIKTDLVLSAIGVRARTQLAADAGLACARGIVTSRELRTSAEQVYALGDCAEVDGHLLYYIAPLFASARALAATLTGTPTPVHYGTMPVTIKTTLHPVVVCPPASQLAGEWKTIAQDEGGVECHFVDAAGQLRGFALCGNRITQTDKLSRQTPGIMAPL